MPLSILLSGDDHATPIKPHPLLKNGDNVSNPPKVLHFAQMLLTQNFFYFSMSENWHITTDKFPLSVLPYGSSVQHCIRDIFSPKVML